ncbi:olfactory receptor 10A7-like [Engystomops pustulosus]|uniref:olfactory receptor 10A7-like n=1 Tax=Engystomops pustulosus TaxID=76066 RepID=UPI003AFA10F9
MEEKNLTSVTEFLLSGFQLSQHLKILLYFIFFFVFIGTICGNLLIIVLVSTSRSLHTPMYFFIAQLSISDILLSSNIVPKMLHVLLHNEATITFSECFTQLYFFSTSETQECLLLAVMSYDRYVAICNPLHYNSTMTISCCGRFSMMCWLLGISVSLIDTITPSRLIFCGPNIIDHFFCDIVPILNLACSDTFIVQIEITLLSFPLIISPTIIIIVSYINIIVTVLKISSSTGRQKAFSTCSSHLIVVSIFYWTLFSVYVFPKRGQASDTSKILSLLYTVLTPLMNPIIYSLRNKDIWNSIQKNINRLIM